MILLDDATQQLARIVTLAGIANHHQGLGVAELHFRIAGIQRISTLHRALGSIGITVGHADAT